MSDTATLPRLLSMPLTKPQARTERDLQLSRAAQTLAPILYQVLHYHGGGDGIGLTWHTASEADRRHCQKAAEIAVMAVNEIKERDAERKARLVLQGLLRDACDTAAKDDATHSNTILVWDALQRAQSAFFRMDPMRLLLNVYKDGLVLPATEGGAR